MFLDSAIYSLLETSLPVLIEIHYNSIVLQSNHAMLTIISAFIYVLLSGSKRVLVSRPAVPAPPSRLSVRSPKQKQKSEELRSFTIYAYIHTYIP